MSEQKIILTSASNGIIYHSEVYRPSINGKCTTTKVYQEKDIEYLLNQILIDITDKNSGILCNYKKRIKLIIEDEPRIEEK